MKNTFVGLVPLRHQHGPNRVKAIEKLIELENPQYQDVKIDENFLEKEINSDDINEAEGTPK